MAQEINTGIRLVAMLIDHFAMTCVAMVFFIPGMISVFSTAFDVSHAQTSIDIFGGLSYIAVFGFALYLCKDAVNGRSVAKRVMKIQVVDNQTNEPASPIKCLIRNLFCAVWPIEVLVTMANPSRRIGDLVAGTKVIPFDERKSKQASPNYSQVGISIVMAYGLMLLLLLPAKVFTSMIEANQETFIEASSNDSAAAELSLLFESKLGDELVADTKIYDEVEGEPDLIYISLILTLNSNYLDDDDDFEEIQNKVETVLLSKHTEGTFVGQVKYVYKARGTMMTRTTPLGL